MKSRRDELRKKRGALELNSDLDLDDNYRAQQEARADLPSSVGASLEVGTFKSKLHSQIKRQEREAKEQFKSAMAVKQEKNERIRNYAKNVKDLYMPASRGSRSQNRDITNDEDGTINSTAADERRSYLGADAENGLRKEIKPRLRSGVAQVRTQDGPNANEYSDANSLAD